MMRVNPYSSEKDMDIRTKLAMEAMKAIETANFANEYQEECLSPREIANRAVLMADKLLKRLNSDGPLQKPEPVKEKKSGFFGG